MHDLLPDEFDLPKRAVVAEETILKTFAGSARVLTIVVYIVVDDCSDVRGPFSVDQHDR